jgi:hypothetical protein
MYIAEHGISIDANKRSAPPSHRLQAAPTFEERAGPQDSGW